MNQPYPPSPMQPAPYVMVPVAQSNGLGVFGFFVALIGLVIPTGVVALLGLVLSLAAIGRAPRGFATAGVIIGVLGSVFWLLVMVGMLGLGLVAAMALGVFAAGAFLLTQPEVVEITSDMVNVAIAVEEYHHDNDAMPEGLEALGLSVTTATDPWGTPYRIVLVDAEPGYDVISGGPDRVLDTDDDVRLSTLDRLWEEALENFDENMEEFGERMERLQRHNRGGGYSYCNDHYAGAYERAAQAEVDSATAKSGDLAGR